jgi:hypothetical protein
MDKATYDIANNNMSAIHFIINCMTRMMVFIVSFIDCCE